MTRLNGLDRRAPTLSPNAVRVVGGQFIETDSDDQLGTWTFDVFIPAYAVVQDIIVCNEVLWGATSATMDVGDYAVDSDTGGIDATTELDADGFYDGLTLISGGNVLAGESVDFAHVEDAVDGAYLSLTDTHQVNGRIHTADRFIRFELTTGTAAGTQAGKTFVYVVYATPELDESTFAAA